MCRPELGQGRKPNTQTLGSLTPDQPDGLRNSLCVLSVFNRSPFANGSSFMLQDMMSKQWHQAG
jgi:hypothetical protein